ncbi:hypothetical protein ACFTSD_06400 [Nocardiaceae bacterium NPDC056970]
MTLQERRAEWYERSEWWSAAFWLGLVSAAYAGLLHGWWVWLPLAVIGIGVTYGWWRRRPRGRFWFVYATGCATLGLLALVVVGLAVSATQSVAVDSVAEVECGSVVRPVAGDQLVVTPPQVVTAVRGPIPHSELERRCRDRLARTTQDAAGGALVGALLVARAVGHVVPRRPVSAV